MISEENIKPLLGKKMKLAKRNAKYLLHEFKKDIKHKVNNDLEVTEEYINGNPLFMDNQMEYDIYIDNHLENSIVPLEYLLILGLKAQTTYPILDRVDVNACVPDFVVSDILDEYFPAGKCPESIHILVKYTYLEFIITKYCYLNKETGVKFVDCFETFPFEDLELSLE